MLVVTRSKFESVMIGDDIEVTLLDVQGDKVRIGFSAPKHVEVHRKEVWAAIKRDREIEQERKDGAK